MNMIKVFSIGIFLALYLSNLAVAEDRTTLEGIPSNYSECTKAEQRYKTVSSLKCDYSILPDKTNTSATEKFLQCRFQYPEYKELAGLSCQYVLNEGNTIVPRILRCFKNGANYFPGVSDDSACVLRYYNPDYTFPKNFQECKLQGGEMSQTYTEKETCQIIVELCIPEYNKTYCTEIYNKNEAEILLNKCRKLGGQFEKKLEVLPQCTLLFMEQ